MFCIYCGAEIPENGAFCPVCGSKAAVFRAQEKEKASGKKMHAAVCASCGSGSLKKAGKGEYVCEHCGSRFLTEEAEDGMSPEEKNAELLVLFAEAEKHSENEDYRAELSTLARGLALAPENSRLLLRLGRACANLGLLREAMEYYRKAEKSKPDYPIVYLNQAILYLKQGLAAEAKPLLHRALALIEADPMAASPGDIAITYANYAQCIGQLGDRAGAEKYLNMAREKHCDSSWLAYVSSILGIP